MKSLHCEKSCFVDFSCFDGLGIWVKICLVRPMYFMRSINLNYHVHSRKFVFSMLD